jgi:hypothetical protein
MIHKNKNKNLIETSIGDDFRSTTFYVADLFCFHLCSMPSSSQIKLY